MEESQKYPLEQLVLIKQKKLEEAEKVLRDKKELLLKEEETLLKVEKERDKVKDHRFAKLTQLRKEMDEGPTPEKIQQARYYLKVVDEQLRVKENKVKEQQKVVDNAKAQVELARTDLIKKQQSVEKMRIHREEWDKEMRAIAEHKEGIETDEMGASSHIRKKASDAKRPPPHRRKKSHF